MHNFVSGLTCIKKIDKKTNAVTNYFVFLNKLYYCHEIFNCHNGDFRV